MSKSSDYYISGVWKDNQGRVTDVLLHYVVDDTTFNEGAKKSKRVVIDLIKKGYVIKTLVWDYTIPIWVPGARVNYEVVGTIEYLRSQPDGSVKNNLDNLILMSAFPI